MEINCQDYQVAYDKDALTVTLQGELALMGMGEYPPIAKLLSQALDDATQQQSEYLTLDLRNLKFLNSSGINIISKFVIKVRRAKGVKMIIKGSDSIPWQEKSLVNLKRLLPSMVVEIS